MIIPFHALSVYPNVDVYYRLYIYLLGDSLHFIILDTNYYKEGRLIIYM